MSIPQVNINKWLLPLSWLYGFIVYIRNKFFEWGILKRKYYNVPVICIGNITVGGTGKTPHTEYLVELLINEGYKVAVLSRGYKRRSRGFVLALENSTSLDIGDEAYQIKIKFPEAIIAVDNKRARGIEKLLNLDKKPDVILLDDAFQHRYVKPSYTILLTDFNRIMTQDCMLPAGRLREPISNAEYANMILVTKCPKTLSPLDQRLISKDIHSYPYQSLMYTSFKYGRVCSVFNDDATLSLDDLRDKNVLAVTGVANPKGLYCQIKQFTENIVTIEYPDHYQFLKKDVTYIWERFSELPKDKIILVTEKDASRFKSMTQLPDDFKQTLYYLPIKVSFINTNEQNLFNKKIINHIRKKLVQTT